MKQQLLTLLSSLLMITLFSCNDSTGGDTNDGPFFTVTITAENGTVELTPNKSEYSKGETVTLKASPSSGYKFKNWSGDTTSAETEIDIVVDTNMVLTAAFIGSNVETVTDIDGNVYTTVKIGDQVWTVENLRTTRYNDGSEIPRISNTFTWVKDTLGAYTYYMGSSSNQEQFGNLYNWYAVNSGKLAPEGWHIPTRAEWDQLVAYLVANGYNWDGSTEKDKVAKALTSTISWKSSTIEGSPGNDTTANNSIGFGAQATGMIDHTGDYMYKGYHGYWWTADGDIKTDDAWYVSLSYNEDNLGGRNRGCTPGICVRLVKD